MTGTLAITGCSLLIDAQLDEKGTSSGSGGAGSGGAVGSTSMSASSVIASASAGASTSTSAGASTSASVAQSSSATGGGCGAQCALPNAKSACVDGACAITMCDDKFGDCDQKPETGCEVNFKNDPAHCGGCDKPCMSGEQCGGAKCK